MSRAELEMVRELQTRENEVQAHEQAHIAAGGRYVQGGASFTYRMGPDGRMYAVGGEVSIDTSPVPGDPQATLDKARQIRRAALAPGEPSAQDLQAAAKASRMAAKARAELRQEGSSESGAAGPAQSGQETSRPLADSAAPGSRDGKGVQSLHAPPPAQVVRHAYIRQSGGEGPAERAAGQTVQRRA
jgi:hypothetical protein